MHIHVHHVHNNYSLYKLLTHAQYVSVSTWPYKDRYGDPVVLTCFSTHTDKKCNDLSLPMDVLGYVQRGEVEGGEAVYVTAKCQQSFGSKDVI